MCALRLKQTVNMIDHDYWVIEKHENMKIKGARTTELILMLYTSVETRQAGQEPVLRERYRWNMTGNDKTSAAAYAHVKQSRMEPKDIHSDKEEDKVLEEKNKFVTAEDIL